MAIAEVTVIPVGTASTSLSGYVAEIQRVLLEEQSSGSISFQLTAMSTIIEGEMDELLRVIRLIHELPFQTGAQRVCTNVKFDDRRDLKGTIKQKMNSVADRMK
ncbi:MULTISPECIES: MTH1187 family thiamine-binding protein [unclassified Paenibacillus]|uniref:MTH1187 family thiamine-binding protein n=1 Tax=unclassified Paenibacillus TaxID=185978 RepID=UPI001AE48F08|nr:MULTISPECIES: MTH1187 family thiamine-binding protein [unclassified Paenibacillus]MBP1156571.1 uncharacterized protein (TIGR00106 family) [Paenibacillus sp. PvP091]MBP1172691.1 uncharacterized protein (TIGR00106 family) [Paenibacillus sp. PvR098]MBP2439071.1 uncharacterized protein (TIGR00106 family) [Paenibacillus sp. PvP052]